MSETKKKIIVDTAGRSNAIGIFGEQLATDIVNNILVQFSYGKSTRDLKNETVVGSGTVSIQGGNLLTASSGVDSNGLAEIQSVNSIRYRPAHTALSHFTAMFTNPLADNSHQWIGIADGVNGFAIGFIDGKFAIMRIRDSVHTHIFKEDFNGSVDISKIDFTKLNVFKISFGYLGSAPIVFEVMPPGENSFRPIHTVYYQGTSEETHIQLPYLPIKMKVENTGNTTDVQIRSGSWQGGVMGFCQTCGNRPFSYPNTVGQNISTLISTTPKIIAAFRSKTTFQGSLNKISAKLVRVGFTPFAPTENLLFTLQLVGGITLTGVEGVDYNFIDIDSVNSITEVSTDVAAFTGGEARLTLDSFPTTSGSKETTSPTGEDLDALGLSREPGQIFGIVCTTNVGTASVAWAINWTELF